MFDFLVILDAGHGGIHPKTGRYTTAPNKQYRHRQGHFHSGGWFYEGVFNRTLTDMVAYKLSQKGIPHEKVYDDWMDLGLSWRAQSANQIAKYKARNTMLLSNHANASGSGLARGFEVFTSPGNTVADWIAETYFNAVQSAFGDTIKYRFDLRDRDHDKEARFYILTQTKMPAILGEHLFFDNFQDARLLMLPETIEKFADAQVKTCLAYARRLGLTNWG